MEKQSYALKNLLKKDLLLYLVSDLKRYVMYDRKIELDGKRYAYFIEQTKVVHPGDSLTFNIEDEMIDGIIVSEGSVGHWWSMDIMEKVIHPDTIFTSLSIKLIY
jgi:hypothetical protein